MNIILIGLAGAALAVLGMACTLDSSGRTLIVSTGAHSTGGAGGVASTESTSGAGGEGAEGDTQASGSGGHSCASATDCPGNDTACATRACDNGTCMWMFAPSGTALPDSEQAQGDCKQRQCGQNGEIVAVASTQDLPPDDGRDCTLESCDGTTPRYKPLTGNACGSGSCAGSVWTPPPTCNDQGECKAAPSQNCTPQVCDPSSGCQPP